VFAVESSGNHAPDEPLAASRWVGGRLRLGYQ